MKFNPAGLLGGLFPGLAQRQRAKQYNALVDVADRIDNTKRAYSNRMAGNEAAFNAWANGVASKKILRDLGNANEQLDRRAFQSAQDRSMQALQSKMSEKQFLGVMFANQAQNGTIDSAASKMLADAARMQTQDQRAAMKRQGAAEVADYRDQARQIAANAMNAIPSDVVNAQLDYTVTKSQKMQVKSPWSAVIGDVGRLALTYYTGGVATPFIDAMRGTGQDAAATQQGIEGAYGRIFGGARTAPNTIGADLTSLVGLAGAWRAASAASAAGAGAKNAGKFSWGQSAKGIRAGRMSNGWALSNIFGR